MKKIFHKNQIVITSLAVLIAVAGYVSYDRKSGSADKDAQVVSNTDLLNHETNDKADTDGADLAGLENSEEDLNPGEVLLTSADASFANYAAQVRLNREQVRSKNRETLQSIIDSDSLDEAQKQEALDKMLALTDIAEREAGAEMMLEAKGFSNVVVSVSEDCCDVVLDMGDVTDQKRAQVEDIVKRKTNVAAENIVITPIGEKKE